MIEELYTPQQVDLRARAREVAETVMRPVAMKYDAEQTYPWEVQHAIRDAGLSGVWIPKEYGGLGGGVLDLCLVVEEFSRACGGMGVGFAVNALGSFPIIVGGTNEQKERWLPGIAAGEKLIAFGLSEKEAGSDAGSMKTLAERNGDHYVLRGEKKWNTGGSVASFNTIFAVTEPGRGARGVSAFVVEEGTPGYRVGKHEDKMGIRCVPVVEIHLEDCRVPAENLLGGEEGRGFKHAMITLDRARPGVAAQAVGLAQGALDLAMQYTHERQQFGQSVSSFQGVQWMLADMATQVEAARQLVHHAARVIDSGHRHITKVSAMCKLMATDVAMRVTTDCVQLFGGYGYCKDYPIEKYMRDAKITQIYEGTNQIQRLVIARSLLREAASGGT
ncbi:MAG: acyl-CoA dehydrogenase family protein [Gemmatimonadota bacterium]|nr:acyl-CoA dehydrogenase family protein [Gemmatimonadota bacterium]MDH3477893.1 acyl-CoA dehydrogenase family protein [Gemmatimonadota bacterium]MDH3570913.1 acyl-CoA dehydrogenase family protein [Gemmatimonadota bacterium]MDH5551477.1 acyl-CoA dehydrogenase family protein [Gemmatimonadota bacterium]